jgi:hypothetical protein
MMKLKNFSSLHWEGCVQHFRDRRLTHEHLLHLLSAEKWPAFSRLALGEGDDDPHGNYSAHDHGLGWRVLGENLNAEKRVVALAEKPDMDNLIDQAAQIAARGDIAVDGARYLWADAICCYLYDA